MKGILGFAEFPKLYPVTSLSRKAAGGCVLLEDKEKVRIWVWGPGTLVAGAGGSRRCEEGCTGRRVWERCFPQGLMRRRLPLDAWEGDVGSESLG